MSNDIQNQNSPIAVRNSRIYDFIHGAWITRKLDLLRRALIFFLALPVFALVVGSTFVPSANAIGETLYESAGGTRGSGTGWNFTTGFGSYGVGMMYKALTNQYACSLDLALTTPAAYSTSTTYLAWGTIYENTQTVNPLSNYTRGEEIGTITAKTYAELQNATDTLEFNSCLYFEANKTYMFEMDSTGSTGSDSVSQSWATTDITNTNSYWWFNQISGGWTAYGNRAVFKLNGYPSSLEVVGIFTDTFPTSTFTGFLNQSSTRVYTDCGTEAAASTTLEKFGCNLSVWGEKFIDYLFVPDADSYGAQLLDSGVERITSIFPFNIFFDFTSVLSSQIAGYSATDNSITFTLPSPTAFSYTVNSSTLDFAVGSSTRAYIRTTQEYLLWLVLLWGIYRIAHH